MHKRKIKNNSQTAYLRYADALNYWYTRLYNMCVSSIKWENTGMMTTFPIIEKTLINSGGISVTEDDILSKLLFLPYRPIGSINQYGYHTNYEAVGSNGYHRKFTNGRDGVVIISNPSAESELPVIQYYAEQLATLTISWRVNIIQTRTTAILAVPENELLSVENRLAQIEEGVPWILEKRELNKEFEELNLNIPYTADKISDEINKKWSEWLTWIGVPSMTIEKKANLLKDEVSHSLGGTLASRATRFQYRQEGARITNEIFGTNIEPVFYVDVVSSDEIIATVKEKSNE